MPPIQLQSGPVALYGQLTEIFRDKIRSGVWPDGSEIPTLEELTKEYSLARVTVRQAIQELAREGLLSSHRGRRTKVINPTPKFNPAPQFLSIHFGESTTGDYYVEILSVDIVKGENIPKFFRGKHSGEYVLLRKVDFEGGEPYSTSSIYILKSVYDRFPESATEATKVARLASDYGSNDFTKCIERISVKAADAEEAKLLDCSVRSPLGFCHRVFLNDVGEIIYHGEHSYRGDRFGIERDITAAIIR